MSKESENLQLITTFYKRRDSETSDMLALVYKDLDTGIKDFKIISHPKFRFYVTKLEYDINHHMSFIEKDKVEPVTCYYSDVTRTIAEMAGQIEEFNAILKSKNFRKLKLFHTYNWVFQSDMDIEDYYKGKWLDKYPIEKYKLTKGFYDIEVDGKGYEGFPESNIAPCPINAVTYIYKETRDCYTFLLRNPKNPKIAKLEKDIKRFKKELKESYDDLNLNFHIFFFDKELDLIKALFETINETKPDICAAWNMSFDLITLENRILRLGGTKEEIICHEDFPKEIRSCFYVRDYVNKNKPEDNGDFYQCTSYTVYMDQLNIYAGLRKSEGRLPSYSLQAISEKEEIGTGKIDYSDVSNIKELPYDDYELFVKYNIRDVICQLLIEEKVEDFDQIYLLSNNTRTRLHKTLKKTISLKNLYTKFCNDNGLVIGNNINSASSDLQDEAEEGEISDRLGGYVADPLLNDFRGKKSFGKKSRFIYDNVIDMDMSSLYPSIIRSNNIEASTQYGRYIIGNEPPNKLNDPGGDFIDNFQCEDWIQLGMNYLGLPSIGEMLNLINEEGVE